MGGWGQSVSRGCGGAQGAEQRGEPEGLSKDGQGVRRRVLVEGAGEVPGGGPAGAMGYHLLTDIQVEDAVFGTVMRWLYAKIPHTRGQKQHHRLHHHAHPG